MLHEYIYNTYMEEGCFADVQDFEEAMYNLNFFFFGQGHGLGVVAGEVIY